MRATTKPAAPSAHARPAGGDTRGLRDWLLWRQVELRREWLSTLAGPVADDDLLPVQQHVENALVEVGEALERIDGRRFGVCVACHGPIERDRLVAHPGAARCWPCQQAAELPGSDPAAASH